MTALRALTIALACAGAIAAALALRHPVADAQTGGNKSSSALPKNPKELGWVHWERSLDSALARARRENKPIFALFQEVPGCSTCVGFGESVLSHPLLIEAIETEFVPLAIYNNLGGADRKARARYGEPAWNNPVVRFLDPRGGDLLPRKDRVWSTEEIARRSIRALRAARRRVPDYLTWVVEESSAHSRSDTSTFAMHCYWAGESCLGGIAGVTTTSAGWASGREVVEVEFDPSLISRKQLAKIAEKRGCGELVARSTRARPAKSSDQKYHLQKSAWRYVPLTPRQQTRINAALGRGKNPSVHASPRQRALYRRVVSTLERRPHALTGLRRPERVRELAAYQARLEARLR